MSVLAGILNIDTHTGAAHESQIFSDTTGILLYLLLVVC